MKLDEIVAWYQKKIGTYDKQQWEKTVEQKILGGFNSVTLKTAKLKTEFIDVDLVRGSTFPKAKPKQSLLTVIRFAILRYLFLPVYAQWWVKQTSPNIFGMLLFMYITQMINWAVYTYNTNIHRLEHNTTAAATLATAKININSTLSNTPKQIVEHIVSISELVIPMVLSLLLSLIHSQIVATNTVSGTKTKRRRFSNSNTQNKKLSRSETRVRRRKKLVKIRSQELADAGIQLQPLSKKYSAIEVSTKINVDSTKICSSSEQNTSCTSQQQQEVFNTTSIIIRNSSYKSPIVKSPAMKLKLDLSNDAAISKADPTTSTLNEDDANALTYVDNHKKRNVNWHSPIHNYATTTQEKQQQTSPQPISSTTTSSETSTPNNPINAVSSSNSSSNSHSNKASPTKTVRINECVQEFYEDLIRRTDELPTHVTPLNTSANSIASTDDIENHSHNGRTVTTRRNRNIGEDDGFESLNGKSSSGEESHNTVLPTTSTAFAQNQLRLRTNAGDCQSHKISEGSRMDAELKTLNPGFRRKFPQISDLEKQRNADGYQQVKKTQGRIAHESTEETEDEGDDGETISSPTSFSGHNSNYNECTTSATEWLGITTNSEECSYSSELENSDYKSHHVSDEGSMDMDFTPTMLNPHSTDRISCTIWDQREFKKAQMSVLEISSCIIERVESMPETKDYICFGVCFSVLLSLIPCFCRLCEVTIDAENSNEISYLDLPMLLWQKASFSFYTIFRFAFGNTKWERTVLIIGLMQRLILTLILFIIFSVAERTFKQRFLYAKLFSHLTSSRRARKSNLPHFRLNKVRNIKTWLSIRSYLKRRGPQRSVDIIVSAAFIVTLLLLAFLSVEWLKDSVHLHTHLNLEALLWSTTIGIFLLRFMTLGNKIHAKYRSISVLITEQINLYLQIEQKPKKKDELMVSNSVLKLAADLLKELETPFKISGLSANPYLFTTIKVVILSALSGVLSEMLGFKLKLHKIKIK